MCLHKFFAIIFVVTIQLVLVSFAKSIDRNELKQISETIDYKTDLMAEIVDGQKQLTFNIDIDEGEIKITV